jgi:gliding motility-associated-like protein
VFSQETYNDCNKALDLCPNLITKANNILANKTLCTDCEDDFSSKLCFPSNNTIWFRFYTNDVGGDVTININSINYLITPGKSQNLQASILQAKVACDASTYKSIGNCISNGSNAITLNANGLAPNETFYLVINGAQNMGDNSPAEASFELQISGTGVNRPIPSITLDKPKDKYCQNDVFTFKCSTADCNDSSTYHWFLNDELIAITDTNLISLSKLKTGDHLKVSNTCFKSCPFMVKDSLNLPLVVKFDVFAGNDTTVYEGSTFNLNGKTSVDTVRWLPFEFISDTISPNPSIKAKKTITYSFSGIKNGCVISDLKTIHVIQKNNKPPTSFSPNGDNINDVWEIPFLEDFPNCHIQIFTRWGQSVFETTGYNYLKSWDGKYNGNLVDPGTYFYVIELRDLEITEPIKGSLTIVR